MDKNTFAVTPPMGWNSFDYYDTNVREQDIRANADYMAQHLREFGWEYIVADIQWYAYDTGTQREQYEYIPFSRVAMDEYGRLLPNTERFPSAAGGEGFAPLADYIHGLGLKFGIHIMRGVPRTAAEQHLPVKGTNVTADRIADPASICLWNPDMYGVRDTPEGQCYYDSLMELYASWGVDFVKCDDICRMRTAAGGNDAQTAEIRMISRAIQNCGRPIVLSLSPGPALLERGTFYAEYANMWRLTDDFWDNWPQLRDMFDRCERWIPFAQRGCYPDCDMLPLGRIGKEFLNERDTCFTLDEQMTMLTLWCMVHSPLMLGAELTQLDKQTFGLLTQPEVLSLNKNMDNRVFQVMKDETQAAWVSAEPSGEKLYLALFNFRDRQAELDLPETLLSDRGILLKEFKTVTDVWIAAELDRDSIAPCTVKAHGVRLLRFV